MTRKVSIIIDGVRHRVLPDDETPETADGSFSARAPPREETDMDNNTRSETRPFPPIGRFEKHLIAPPQILGCERTPFLVLVGVVAFLVIVVFGIDIFGIIGAALIFIGGVRWLRAMFEQDPHWFAMRWLGMRYPRHLPDELPPAYMKDWAFVGYDDPPAPEEVFMAWLKVIAAMLVPAGLVALFFGLFAGGVTFAALMLAVLALVFTEDVMGVARKITGRA